METTIILFEISAHGLNLRRFRVPPCLGLYRVSIGIMEKKMETTINVI